MKKEEKIKLIVQAAATILSGKGKLVGNITEADTRSAIRLAESLFTKAKIGCIDDKDLSDKN